MPFPQQHFKAPKPLTYRVENIPAGTTSESELRKFFHTDDRQHIHLKSLVPDVDNYDGTGTLTATILFTAPPPREPCSDDDDHDVLISADFEGFTPLNVVDGEAKADIIALTGLAGHAFGSWAIKPEKMWLRDDLPKALKNQARILIYGYKSPIQGQNVGVSIIQDFATKFWESVMHMRSEPACMNRPLILIGHSLGGLVIKHVSKCLNSTDGKFADVAITQLQCIVEEDPDILPRHHLRAIFFFGTPHGGLDHDALRTLVKDEPNESLIHELNRNSPTLRNLSNKFKKRMSSTKTPIFTYYESEKTRTLVKDLSSGVFVQDGPAQLMVDVTSASLNYDREKCVQADGDHRTMVRLRNTQAGIFRSLVGHMKECIKSGAELHEVRRQAGSHERTLPYLHQSPPNETNGAEWPAVAVTRVDPGYPATPPFERALSDESEYTPANDRFSPGEDLRRGSSGYQPVSDQFTVFARASPMLDRSSSWSVNPPQQRVQRALSSEFSPAFEVGGQRFGSPKDLSQTMPRDYRLLSEQPDLSSMAAYTEVSQREVESPFGQPIALSIMQAQPQQVYEAELLPDEGRSQSTSTLATTSTSHISSSRIEVNEDDKVRIGPRSPPLAATGSSSLTQFGENQSYLGGLVVSGQGEYIRNTLWETFVCGGCGKQDKIRKLRFLCMCCAKSALHKDCFLAGDHDPSHPCIAVLKACSVLYPGLGTVRTSRQQKLQSQSWEPNFDHIRGYGYSDMPWNVLGAQPDCLRFFFKNFRRASHHCRFEVGIRLCVNPQCHVIGVHEKYKDATLSIGLGQPHSETRFTNEVVAESDPNLVCQSLFSSFASKTMKPQFRQSSGAYNSIWLQYFSLAEKELVFNGNGFLGIVLSWSGIPQSEEDTNGPPVLMVAIEDICYVNRQGCQHSRESANANRRYSTSDIQPGTIPLTRKECKTR